MVVANGSADGPGAGGKSELDAIVARARKAASPAAMGWNLYVDANDTDVRIDSDKPEVEGEVFEVVVVVYEPGSQKIKVGKGPNKGQKMEHRNIVKNLVKIGEWRGGTAVIPLPTARSAMPAGQEAVVIVQLPGGGPIVGAVKV